MKFHHFDCSCGSIEHSIRLITGNENKEVFVQYYFPHKSLLQRILLSIRYIFKKDKSSDCFGETLLNEDEVRRMINILKEVE